MLARTSYHPLMARLVFGMSQSLDGYVDDAAGTLCMPPPRPALFRHFIDVVVGHAGAIYGRRIYEVMRYWDVERPEWDVAEREFAAAWQRQPKWIASRTLASVGPNAANPSAINSGVSGNRTMFGQFDTVSVPALRVVLPS